MSKQIQWLAGMLNSGATVTASSTAAGFDPQNAATRTRSQKWKAGGTTSVYLTMDCLSAVTPTGVGIANANFSAMGTTLLRSSTDNASWTTILTLSGLTGWPTVDDTQDFVAAIVGASARRYWRLEWASASSAPYLGVFYLGAMSELPNPDIAGYSETPIDISEESPGADGGPNVETYGRTVLEFGFKWTWLSQTDRDSIRTILLNEGRENPFFYLPRDDSGSGASGRGYLVRRARNAFAAAEDMATRFHGEAIAREEV